MANYTKANLAEVKNMAPDFGYGDNHEAHFANKDLELEKSGLSYQKLFPGKSSPFDHTHNVQEEVYIMLGGSGKMTVAGETFDVKKLDAIRVSSDASRSFEAGDDGLEFIVYGAPKTEEQDANIGK